MDETETDHGEETEVLRRQGRHGEAEARLTMAKWHKDGSAWRLRLDRACDAVVSPRPRRHAKFGFEYQWEAACSVGDGGRLMEGFGGTAAEARRNATTALRRLRRGE